MSFAQGERVLVRRSKGRDRVFGTVIEVQPDLDYGDDDDHARIKVKLDDDAGTYWYYGRKLRGERSNEYREHVEHVLHLSFPNREELLERPECALVEELLTLKPWDEAKAGVLADWCEEHGLGGAAWVLRATKVFEPLGSAAKMLQALRFCLGLELPKTSPLGWRPRSSEQTGPTGPTGALGPSGPIEHRQPLSFGAIDETPLAPGEVREFPVMAPQFAGIVERVMLPTSIAGSITVESIMIGRRDLLHGAVPGLLFAASEVAPFTEDSMFEVNESVSVRVRNVDSEPIRVLGALMVRPLPGAVSPAVRTERGHGGAWGSGPWEPFSSSLWPSVPRFRGP